jgi:hypothetical protein
VEVFLNDDVTSTDKRFILITDERGINRSLLGGVLSSIDKAEEVAGIEVSKTLYFIHHRDCITQTRHNLRSQLETKVKVLSTNVKKEITRRSHGMASFGMYLLEWLQLRWPRLSEEPIPRFTSNPHHARKAGGGGTKSHGPNERG